MTDREKMIEALAVIFEDYRCGRDGKTATEAATSVLELVGHKPLVWDGAVSRLKNGCYYTAIQSRSGKSWCVDYVSRGGSVALGYLTDELSAQAAAQAHADAAHWANTKIGGVE